MFVLFETFLLCFLVHTSFSKSQLNPQMELRKVNISEQTLQYNKYSNNLPINATTAPNQDNLLINHQRPIENRLSVPPPFTSLTTINRPPLQTSTVRKKSTSRLLRQSSERIIFQTSIDSNYTLSVHVLAPTSVLSACSHLRLSLSNGDPRDYIRPLSSLVQFTHFPTDVYCLHLRCDCVSDLCRYLPPPPAGLHGCRPRQLPGIDRTDWNVSVVHEPEGDTGHLGGPALQLTVVQHGWLRFPSLVVFHNGSGNWSELHVTADQVLRLGVDCRLQYDACIEVEVVPDTWFCEDLMSPLCFSDVFVVPPLRRGAPTAPLLFEAAPPTPLAAIVAGVAAVLVVALVLVVVVNFRRRYKAGLCGHDNEVALSFGVDTKDANSATTLESPATGIEASLSASPPPGGRLRVLLIHSAATAGETAAVECISAALRRGGASVTDLMSLGWPPAGQLVSAATDRVLVLSGGAAVAGGRLSPRQRLFVWAVQQLAGDAGAGYGRVFVARLGPDAPEIDLLTPGVRYSLPGDSPQLLRDLLRAATVD